jgi:hypothetical protein
MPSRIGSPPRTRDTSPLKAARLRESSTRVCWPVQRSLLDEGGLADAAAPVQDDQRSTLSLEFALENSKILLTSDETGHCDHPSLIKIIIIEIIYLQEVLFPNPRQCSAGHTSSPNCSVNRWNRAFFGDQDAIALACIGPAGKRRRQVCLWLVPCWIVTQDDAVEIFQKWYILWINLQSR